MLDRLSSYEIKPPRLYEMGFPHNNCGGFCVKAGKTHFKLLLEQLPERYKYHEEQENNLRKLLNKDVTILREQKDGQQRRLPLAILRQRIEGGDQIDKFDWGGCGCFLDVEDRKETVGQ